MARWLSMPLQIRLLVSAAYCLLNNTATSIIRCYVFLDHALFSLKMYQQGSTILTTSAALTTCTVQAPIKTTRFDKCPFTAPKLLIKV